MSQETLKSVQYAFAVEPHHSMKVLNRYIQKYPEFEAELRELRIFLQLPDDEPEKQ